VNSFGEELKKRNLYHKKKIDPHFRRLYPEKIELWFWVFGWVLNPNPKPKNFYSQTQNLNPKPENIYTQTQKCFGYKPELGNHLNLE